MKKASFLASLALAASVSPSMAVVIIDGTTNNGSLMAPVGSASGVNGQAVTSTNTNGRALGPNGGSFATDLLDITTITDNPGIGIADFTVYRDEYMSGNNAYGFLENGGRLGKANAANDGQAFANSSEFVLVSDNHNATVSVGSVINFSFLAGSDLGFTTLRTFLLFDGGTEVEVTSFASSATFDNTFGTVSGSFVATASASTIGIYIHADGNPGIRTTLDDIFLEVVPEPSSSALLGLAGLSLLVRRRRK